MGKAQKEKGNRREREFAQLISGQRIPLSGAAKHAGAAYTGDVNGLGLCWEVKSRRDGFKQLYSWLAEEAVDALAIRADRKEWLAVIPLEILLPLLGERSKDHG